MKMKFNVKEYYDGKRLPESQWEPVAKHLRVARI